MSHCVNTLEFNVPPTVMRVGPRRRSRQIHSLSPIQHVLDIRTYFITTSCPILILRECHLISGRRGDNKGREALTG